MADATTIGKLVVQMLLDGSQYSEGTAQVGAQTQQLGGNLERLVAVLRTQLADALNKAAAATEALAVIQNNGSNAAQEAAATAEKAAQRQETAASNLSAKAEKEAQQRAEAEMRAAQQSVNAQVAEQQRLSDIIYRLEQRSSSDVQRLEREKARVLAGIAKENVAERTRIEELYSAEIGRVKQAEADKAASIAKQEADRVVAEQARAQAAVQAQIQQLGEGIRQRLAGVADAIGSALTTGFTVAAAAITGVAAASVYTGATFEQKMKQVGVVAGATATEMEALVSKARELGATTSYSASEAADAMQNLASAGMPVSDVLRAAGDALVLAGAGGTDLKTSSAALTSTLAQFSLQADQSARVADVFAKATAGSQFEVADLAEAMKYGGVAGAGFGMSLEQTVAALALFRNAGLQGSAAGTAFRSALVGATTASKTNTDALAQYGLTMEDINPATHDFAEILRTVGTAGMDTADVIKIFGVESGAVVATLAQQAAQGSSQYQQMLADLEGATGTATAMYKEMNATVTGSFAELSSAAEEFLLSLFDTYKGPLLDLLNAVTDVVNRTVAAIKGSSGEIGASMETALGSIATFISDNAEYIAQAIAGFVVDVAAFAAQVEGLLPFLQELLPLLDDIALAMGLVWVAIKVAQFVSAVESAIMVLGTLGVSVETVMGIMTAATGGTYALVAAIGVLVAGLAVLVDRYLDAEEAATKLKAAQDKLSEGQVRADASRAAQLEALLAVQREEARQQLEQEAASGKLTQARRAELEMLSSLTGATAQQMEAAGKLVQVNGQLRTAGSIAEEMDPATVTAFNAQVDALGRKAAAASNEIGELQAALAKAQEVDEGAFAYDQIVASILDVGDASVKTMSDAQARITQLQQQSQEYGAAAGRIQADYSKATSAMLETEARAQVRTSARKVAAVRAETSEKVAVEKQYVDKVAALHAGLERENSMQSANALQQLDADMQARMAALRTAYAEQIQSAGKNSAEVARLEKQQQSDQLILLSIWASKRQEVMDDASREEADKRAAAEQRAQNMVVSMQRDGMTDAQRLETEKADALASIAEASAHTRAQVEELYNEKIAQAQTDATARTKAAADKMKAVWASVTSGVRAVVSAVQSVGSALSGVGQVASDFVGFWLDALERLTGFSFSLADAMSAVTDALEKAGSTDLSNATVAGATPTVVEGGASLAGGTVGSAATGYVQQIVDGAVEFVKAMAKAIPYLIEALVSGIPDVVDALVSALPDMIAALAKGIPQLAQLFADEMPRVLEALVAGVPQLVEALVRALPVMVEAIVAAIPTIIDAVLSALPTLIQALVDAAQTLMDALLAELPRLVVGIIQMIPGIVQQILAHLPAVITALLAGIVDIISAILEALPDIVIAIVDALPAIIIALIDGVMDAIPTIIMGVIRAIPKIIMGIIQGIPDIINAVLSSIPTIITTLVGMVPDLISGLVESLPDLIPALIGMIPDLLSGLFVYLPEIIVAVFEALFVELPQQIPKIAVILAETIVEALKSAWDAIVDMFSNLWKSIFGGKKDSDKGSGYTGVTYVPSTMRMTLHPGEMVVPANRNPMRARDRADPAIAGAGGVVGGGSGSGGQPFQLDVLVDGRVVESVLMSAQKRGTATHLTRFVRTTAGVQAGLDRGKFNRWSK